MNTPGELITTEGREKVRVALGDLEARLQEIRRIKAEAAAQTGNVWHDNAAYETAQMDETMILRRIAELEGLLRRSKLVEVDEAQARDSVQLGSRVLVRFDDGEALELTLRGAGEVNLGVGAISVSSPLARGILGARAGERRMYSVQGRPMGVTVVRILRAEA